MMLPFGQLRLDVWSPRIDCVPEFLPIRTMGPLDLAVEMRRSWCNGPEFDGPVHEALLNGLCKELAATVGLDALNREWRLLDDVIEKVECARR